MFEEAPNEKIERLRRTFRQMGDSVEHINNEKLRQLNNLITFTKYICQDLTKLPPDLSRFIIYSAKRTTNFDVLKFPAATFHNIEIIQRAIVSEEAKRKMLLEDEENIIHGKDGKNFEDAKRREIQISEILGSDEKLYLEKHLISWYKTLYTLVEVALNAAYRKPGREGYLQYLSPLEKKLRCALKILRKLDILIKNEIWELRNEVKNLEETERFVHENKFAFAR